MTSVNNNQFDQELCSWKIKLEYFKQENVLLKYRLSEMVDNNEGSNFLQMAEYFQNELLIIDDKLKKLFNEFEKLSIFFRETEYKKFMKDIVQFENKFINLSKEFNEKMLENTQH